MSHSGIEDFAKQLLAQVHTTSELKNVSVALETLSQSKSFKSNTNAIVNDHRLTDGAKKSQLLDLISEIEISIIEDFFRDILDAKEFWLFDSDKFDYFDEFVQKFQLLTETVKVINIVAAIELKPLDLKRIAIELSKALDTQVIVHMQIDPKIIGGAKIRIGNLVFDYSLKSKFSQFERQWLNQFEKTAAIVGREEE